MSKFTTTSPYVWIMDMYHPHYPNYIKILEVLPDGKYKVQIQVAVHTDINKGPIEILHESQLSKELLG